MPTALPYPVVLGRAVGLVVDGHKGERLVTLEHGPGVAAVHEDPRVRRHQHLWRGVAARKRELQRRQGEGEGV